MVIYGQRWPILVNFSHFLAKNEKFPNFLKRKFFGGGGYLCEQITYAKVI